MVGTVGGGRGNIPHVTSGKYWKVISELFHYFDFSLGEEHRVFFLVRTFVCCQLFFSVNLVRVVVSTEN